MSAPYDGVQYCVDEHSCFVRSGSDRQLRRSVQHRQGMIDRYHLRIKALYDYCAGSARAISGLWPEVARSFKRS